MQITTVGIDLAKSVFQLHCRAWSAWRRVAARTIGPVSCRRLDVTGTRFP